MERRTVLWNGMNQESDSNANAIANLLNQSLQTDNKVEVIEVTSNWYMIIGNKEAKSLYDSMVKKSEETLSYYFPH